MTSLDRAIFAANLVFALAAAGINGWAVLRPGPFALWRPLRAATALLAGFYAVGYVAVLTGAVSIAAWSQFFRGVSPVAWLVVWCGPVITSAAVWRSAKRDAAVAVEKIRAESRG